METNKCECDCRKWTIGIGLVVIAIVATLVFLGNGSSGITGETRNAEELPGEMEVAAEATDASWHL